MKGKDYFDYPNKYYCDDLGLRNARIGFRQQEMTHIMENILYNDLRTRELAAEIDEEKYERELAADQWAKELAEVLPF